MLRLRVLFMSHHVHELCEFKLFVYFIRSLFNFSETNLVNINVKQLLEVFRMQEKNFSWQAV